jgi:hypothetical protein
MARYGTINQKTLDNTPGTDGQFLRRQSGVWVPYTLQPSDIPASVRSQLQITASRNLATTDAGRHLFNTSASSFDLTIPNNTFAANDEIEIAADSTGFVNVLAGAGVTINGGNAAVCYPGTAGFLKFRSPSDVRWYGGSSPNVNKQFVLYSDATFRSFQAVGTTTIASISLPANTVSPNGYLSYEVLYKGASTGSKTFAISIGGNSLVSLVAANANTVHAGKRFYNRSNNTIITTGVGAFTYGSSTTVAVGLALNWTINQTITVTAQVATANQGFDLSYLSFEVVNP